MLKLGLAVVDVAVEVEVLVGDAHLPALVAAHILGLDAILDGDILRCGDPVLGCLTQFGKRDCLERRLRDLLWTCLD